MIEADTAPRFPLAPEGEPAGPDLLMQRNLQGTARGTKKKQAIRLERAGRCRRRLRGRAASARSRSRNGSGGFGKVHDVKERGGNLPPRYERSKNNFADS